MTSKRLLFLDIFRGLAVVWMIETHVFHVGLATTWHSGWLYEAVYWSNGFVAQAFAFAAGAGFWLATENSPHLQSIRSPSFWRYARRLGFIFLCGFWLNMKPLSLDHFLHAGPEGQSATWQFDILHFIAVMSFFSLLLHVAIGRYRGRHWIYGLISLVIILATPVVWRDRLGEGWPLPLSLPFMPIPPSKFPIFPWAAYFLAGIFFMGLFMRAQNSQRRIWLISAAASLAPFLLFWIKALPFTYPGMSGPWADWYPSPGHSFFRLTVVVAIFSWLFLLESKFNPASLVTRFLRLNGQESLWMFISHIVLVYGSNLTLGLVDLYPKALGPMEVAGTTALMTAACFAPAAVWHHFKKERPSGAFAILSLAMVCATVFFLITPASPASWRFP